MSDLYFGALDYYPRNVITRFSERLRNLIKGNLISSSVEAINTNHSLSSCFQKSAQVEAWMITLLYQLCVECDSTKCIRSVTSRSNTNAYQQRSRVALSTNCHLNRALPRCARDVSSGSRQTSASRCELLYRLVQFCSSFAGRAIDFHKKVSLCAIPLKLRTCCEPLERSSVLF